MESRIFYFSLGVSFFIHIVVIASLFYARITKRLDMPRKEEIVYYTPMKQAPPLPEQILKKPAVESKTGSSSPIPGMLDKKPSVSDRLPLEPQKKPVQLETHEKSPSHFLTNDKKRQITIPVLKSEKIENPKYLHYNEVIRNRIRERAYSYIDHPDFTTGEVYLTFMLAADGTLRDVKIIEGKTMANNYLRSVGLRSIEESSPFPPFPADLKYPELSFNVIISFKVE